MALRFHPVLLDIDGLSPQLPDAGRGPCSMDPMAFLAQEAEAR